MPAGFVRGTDGDVYTDANGVVRFRSGSIPAVGVSPAHWGVAVYNERGDPQLDALGLIAVASNLGTVTNTSSISGLAGTGAMVDVSASILTFTLARQATVQAWALANTLGTAVNSVIAQMAIDGVYSNTVSMYVQGGNNIFTESFMFAVVTLAAGTHTLRIGLNQIVGQTYGWSGLQVSAVLMGG